MLIRRENLGPILALVVAVIRLDERIVRQLAIAAVVEELLEGAEELRLMLEQVDHLQRRALGVEVVNLRALTGIVQPLVHALELGVRVEHFHPDVAERGAVVGEGAVAERRAGDRREPAVEDRELGRQRGQHRQLVGGEVVHDLARVLHVPALREVAVHEPLHRRDPIGRRVAVEDLEINSRKMMVGIGIELPLILGKRLRRRNGAGAVRIELRPVDAVDPGVGRLQGTEHVIEGAVLHHQDDDVFQLVEAGRCHLVQQYRMGSAENTLSIHRCSVRPVFTPCRLPPTVRC